MANADRVDGPSVEAMSVEETARRSDLGRTTIYAAIMSGALPSLKVGRRRLVRPEAHRAWLHALERRPGS